MTSNSDMRGFVRREAGLNMANESDVKNGLGYCDVDEGSSVLTGAMTVVALLAPWWTANHMG